MNASSSPRSALRRLRVASAAAALAAAGAAAAQAAPATFNACENLATGVIRLLPSTLPPPLDKACNTKPANPALAERAIIVQ